MGCRITDWISETHEAKPEEVEKEEWVEQIPDRHYKKRRYS
jgi:hypothetical protein